MLIQFIFVLTNSSDNLQLKEVLNHEPNHESCMPQISTPSWLNLASFGRQLVIWFSVINVHMSCRPIYTPVVHCKNVRQAARVTSMHEHALSDHFSTDDVKQATGVDLSCAISAALCLQSSEVFFLITLYSLFKLVEAGSIQWNCKISPD